ncbi:MAG: hypothetical protein ACRDYA_15995 [Egibacteraceae bacterium]
MSEFNSMSSTVKDGDWFEIAAKVRVQVMDREQLTKAAVVEARSRASEHEGGEPATAAQIAEIRGDLAEAIIELVNPRALTGNLPGAEPSDAQVSVGACAPFQPPA